MNKHNYDRGAVAPQEITSAPANWTATVEESPNGAERERLAEFASKVASLILIEQNDGAIDLRRAGKAAVAMAEHLADSYMSTLSPIIKEISSDKPYANTMEFLARRLATLEADLFLIKSSLIRNKRFVLGEAAHYSDPLLVLNDLDTDNSAQPALRQLTVKLGQDVLGQGWHAVETQANGLPWRWSGPGTRSSLLLPALVVGRHRISFDFRMLTRDQADGIEFRINGASIEGAISWLDQGRKGRCVLEAQITPNERSSFLFLEILLPRTISPKQLGESTDARMLGIGLSAVDLEIV